MLKSSFSHPGIYCFMLPTKRKQLIISGNSALVIKNTEMPEPASHEVLIKVTAAGVNRGDILQRRGLYKAPDNASAVPGLEVSGKIVKAGIDVTSVKVGDTVCALTEGNGYSD